jgi:eukaryotic-like serine/threonine-protein kinase
MLTREDLEAIEAIFDEVVDLDPALRSSLLDSRPGLRAELRAEVETLLNAHARVGSFMEPVDSQTGRGEPAAAERRVGAMVGPWRLLRRIGTGGMGDVYLAERADGAFAGQAAVKFTRAHLPDPVAARRFFLERQFLASLHHPNIVTLLDGGTTPTGEGYLVMEYVEGTPITEFCRSRALPLEARLSLMRHVCGAVQYAHQRAIVHRDLKPGNILVTADGVPKILDFGVAKLLEGAGANETLTMGVMPGPLTPNYASPEQLRGLGVTTAADVYSLGVLLYELVTGERPYETAGQTLDAVVKLVVDTQPSRPSAPRAGGDTALPYPRQQLRGDLDAVVLKAMRKEPEQRYGSAGEFADDIGRFIAGAPVVAREPSLGYTLRRLAARNKAVVGVTLAAFVAILSALGVALWQRQVAVREQARAEQRFREVRQLANSLIFTIHDRVAKLPGSTPVRREIVDEALSYLERLERDSQGDQALRLELAAAYRQIGNILGNIGQPNLGDREGAQRQLRRSRDILLPIASTAAPPAEAIRSLVGTDRALASVLRRMNDEEAVVLAQEAVTYAERAVQLAYPDAKDLLARAVFDVAAAVHPTDASIPHWRRAETLFGALLAERPDDPTRQRNLALVDKYLGAVFDRRGEDEEAEKHYARALQLDEGRLARTPDDRQVQFDTAISLANMASIAERHHGSDKTFALFTRSLQIRSALSDSDPEDVLARGRVAWVRMRLARLEQERGNLDAALDHARRSVEDQQRVVGTTKDVGSGGDLGAALEALGQIQLARREIAAACESFARAVPLLEAVPRLEQPPVYLERARRARAARCR